MLPTVEQRSESAAPNTDAQSQPASQTPSAQSAQPISHLVVIDACALMSTVIRRLLLRLAQRQVFIPVWSARIGDEWRRNAARLWSIPPEKLTEEWDAMNQAFPKADAGDYAAYETGLRYSDAKDWHVIAAGLASRARCGLQRTPELTVVTWNLKDFNRSELRRQGMGVYAPDRLLTRWWQEDENTMRHALEQTPDDVLSVGRPAEELVVTLHRERLYRLCRLVEASA
jgi:hypothetical protein